MQATEIRVAGLADQGVILFAKTITRAARFSTGTYVLMRQDPDAAGHNCSVQLIWSNKPITYYRVITPHILVAMSQECYTNYATRVRPNGLLIIEQNLVLVTGVSEPIRVYRVPALRIAESLGNQSVLNMAMLGAFGALTGRLERKMLREAVQNSVPRTMRDLNVEACEKGYDSGLEQLASGALTIPTLSICFSPT